MYPTSVKRWWEAYRKKGDQGFAANPVPGRPSKLTARQKERLTKRLLKGAKGNVRVSQACRPALKNGKPFLVLLLSRTAFLTLLPGIL